MIQAQTPGDAAKSSDCTGCGGDKGAPIAVMIHIHRPHGDAKGVSFALCQECGRDAANAIGFLCIRDGGWSKLEPRKKKGLSRLDAAITAVTRLQGKRSKR